ncbi:MAG: hypothetical protein HFF09_07125 [Oscillospiraceae bacterium]|nr:hypothetical protein [Oscillospiraceae bacterium]
MDSLMNCIFWRHMTSRCKCHIRARQFFVKIASAHFDAIFSNINRCDGRGLNRKIISSKKTRQWRVFLNMEGYRYMSDVF